jgi:hypothetical protein
MDAGTRDAVRRRAGHRCEYCLLRQEHTAISHHVEQIGTTVGLSISGFAVPGAHAYGPGDRVCAAMNDDRRLDLRSELLARGELSRTD